MIEPNYQAQGAGITEDNWEFIARDLSWSQLSRQQKADFYEQTWSNGYKTVNWSDVDKAEANYNEWKDTLTDEDLTRSAEYLTEFLDQYKYDNWSRIPQLVKERYFNSDQSEFSSWQKEASRYISPPPVLTPEWYTKMLEEYAANRTAEEVAAAEAKKAQEEQARLDYLSQFAPAENDPTKADGPEYSFGPNTVKPSPISLTGSPQEPVVQTPSADPKPFEVTPDPVDPTPISFAPQAQEGGVLVPKTAPQILSSGPVDNRIEVDPTPPDGPSPLPTEPTPQVGSDLPAPIQPPPPPEPIPEPEPTPKPTPEPTPEPTPTLEPITPQEPPKLDPITPIDDTSTNQMSKILNAKNNTEAKKIAAEDNKLKNSEIKDLLARGVPQSAIDSLKIEVDDAFKQQERVKAASDNKITKEEQEYLLSIGVSQDKIDKMQQAAKDARESTGVDPNTNIPGVTDADFSHDNSSGAGIADKITDLADSGGPVAPAIEKIKEIIDDGGDVKGKDVKELTDLYGGDQAVAALGHIDDLNLSDKAKNNVLDALGIKDQISFDDYIKQTATSTTVTNNEGDSFNVFNINEAKKDNPDVDFFNTKLDKDGLDAALDQYSAKQLLKFYNDGDLKIGKNALIDLEGKVEEQEANAEIGGFKKVKEKDYNKSNKSSAFDDSGILYKTYNTGDGDKILKIGNLDKHRYEGSPYKDIKIVDYDASIENYNPDNLGFVKSVETGSKGKVKSVEFKIPEPKRIKQKVVQTDDKGNPLFDSSGNVKYQKDSDGNVLYEKVKADNVRDKRGYLVRSNEQREDYTMRGVSNGGRVTKFKQDGEYKSVQTDAQGNLKRLTLDDSGEYIASTSSYPSAIRSNSFSDLLETNTGLKIGGSATRSQRLASIKSKLS